MSLPNAMETALLQHFFQNADIANIGDATGLRGSSAAGSFYFSLHIADPGEAGAQNTSEISYTGYARVAVARTAGGFTVSGNQVSNAAAIAFPTCTGGSGTATHFAIGTSVSGAGTLLYSGALNSSMTVGNGHTPTFATGQMQINVD